MWPALLQGVPAWPRRIIIINHSSSSKRPLPPKSYSLQPTTSMLPRIQIHDPAPPRPLPASALPDRSPMWCWTRRIACWTWALSQRSTASSPPFPPAARRCFSARRGRVRCSRWRSSTWSTRRHTCLWEMSMYVCRRRTCPVPHRTVLGFRVYVRVPRGLGFRVGYQGFMVYVRVPRGLGFRVGYPGV